MSAAHVPTAGAAFAGAGSRGFALVDGDASLAGSECVADVLAAAADPPEPFDASPDDVAFWLYTSGTTGFPKAAQHRHADLDCCVESYARGVLGMDETDRVYSVAKLFFAYGLGNAGYFPPATGASAILNPGRPEPREVAEHVRAHEPTLFFGVPTFYAALLNADLPPDTFRSVRLAVSAGEALPADLHRRFGERFGVEVLDGIGTTEILHIFVSNRPGSSVPGTSGTPVPGYDVELRNADGHAVPDGEPGNLWVAGEQRDDRLLEPHGAEPPRAARSLHGDRRRVRTPPRGRSPRLPRALRTTCSRSAASGCRPPRSRPASSSSTTSYRSPSSAATPATAVAEARGVRRPRRAVPIEPS